MKRLLLLPLIKKLIPISLILIILGISLIVSEKEQQKTFNRYLQQAEVKLTERYYFDALGLYQKALLTNPNHYQPYLKIAEIYALRSDLVSAKVMLEQGLKRSKDKDPLYLSLGDLYLKDHQINQAIETYVQLKGESPEKHLHLANAYYQQGERQKALQALSNLTPLPQVVYFQSLAYLFDDPVHARQVLESISFTEDLQSKTQALMEILALEKSDYQTLLLAKELTDQDYPALAIPPLTGIIKNNPHYRDAYLILGQAYFENHQLREAQKTWEQILAIDPTYSQSYYLLSQLSLTQNSFDEAEKWAQKAIYFEQSNPSYYSLLAEIYHEKSSCELEISSQEKVVNDLSLSQTPLELIQNQLILINYYQECQKIDEALLLAEELKNNETNNLEVEINDSYFWSVWLKRQNAAEIVSAYESLVKQYPSYSLGHEHYGKILSEIGFGEKAETEMRRAEELQINNNF